MSSSIRVVINASATFFRTLFNAFLALFASRWVLSGLGHENFGIYAVIISLSGFMSILSSVMSSSVSRYFSFNMKESSDEINKWFNAALSLHFCFALVILITGLFCGKYVIFNFLTIPVEKISTSLVIYQVLVVSIFIGMISVPFTAMFIAHQKIAELSLFGFAQSIINFFLSLTIVYISGDRLLFYGLCVSLVQVVLVLLQVIRASMIFSECRINMSYWFDVGRLKEIASFAGWILIGNLGLLARNQGLAVLLNIYFGPSVNAAYGIANQVSNQANHLSSAMMGALAPEITASEARGDRDRMLKLSIKACKFGTIFVSFFAIPLMVEMNYILNIWLTDPPEYTSIFCRYILCMFLIERLTSGYILAVNAYGKIALFQLTVEVLLIMVLPLAWIFVVNGYSPSSVGLAIILTMTCRSIARVLWIQNNFGISFMRWLNSVFLPSLFVILLLFIGSVIPTLFFRESFFRLVASSMLGIVFASIVTWFIALDNEEKEFILVNIKKYISR